ncbi:CheR family methyltransferase [Paragemmobacter straminiformis]|uniref:protein-glutamate O-methyltransferase n=1 Tax=Paragemmobacter straminiformis TaxID=2045119 RepID=A0A842I552_9RHOB|nr:protein-glutamate O-methyltransferase CheR [Gemmobacter straminiformis]MBC2834786.1 protein-glutamate O-methyltransferase CheR [Gemmobacter straminiformis]
MTMSETQGCEQIRGWLSQRCGIHYPEHKMELLRQRLSRVQRAYTVATLSDLARKLSTDASHELQLAVMHAASTNHTYFFREIEVLQQFRTRILPVLAQRDEIRIWSAACSTGDEAYTLAIMIAEDYGLNALRRTAILGTDISAPVVEQAEAGLFAEQRLERVPADLRRKYFEPAGLAQFRIRQELRDCCTFRQMNLKTTPYPFRKAFQTVFCRNILYYFEQADQLATLNAISDVTEPGGWLVTSVTENIRDLNTRWQPVDNGIHRKGGN